MNKMFVLLFLLIASSLRGDCSTLRDGCSDDATGYGDFDSLHVDVVPFAVIIQSSLNSTYSSYPIPAGGGTTHGAGYGQFFFNQHNLDSIIVDSARFSSIFYGDSAGIEMLYMRFVEIIDSVTTNEKVARFFGDGVGDSLYVSAGECAGGYCWYSKVSACNLNNIIYPPFYMGSWSLYCFNWDDASIVIRLYSAILYGKLCYSIK